MSIIRDIIADLRSLNTISLAEVPDRIRYVLDIVQNPQNYTGLSLFLVVAVIIIVLLIIMISIALAYLLLTKDQRARLVYTFFDENDEVIAQIPVDEMRDEDLARIMQKEHEGPINPDSIANAHLQMRDHLANARSESVAREEKAVQAPKSVRTQRSLLRFARAVIGTTLMVGAGFLLIGIGTQFSGYCTTCHAQETLVAPIMQGEHATIPCIKCHEQGRALASVTVNVLPRMIHVFSGIFATEQSSSQRTIVASSSCVTCHESILDPGAITSKSRAGRSIRMSHSEPVDAGIDCQHCHGLNSAADGLMASGEVMDWCLRCHDTQQASNDCAQCHVGGWERLRTSGDHMNFADAQIAENPTLGCYRCHDPAPCDSCHGIRMPHPESFTQLNTVPSEHALYGREHGVSGCFKCHTEQGSPMGASSCYTCHTIGDF